MKDPAKKESRTEVLSRLWQGKYVYTGLVFFRELPAGVPGNL
jgi:hypothetical protein